MDRRKYENLDLYWKSQPVSSTLNMDLKFELSQWTKTVLILGSEFPMERSYMWSILLRMKIQKFLQIHKKSKTPPTSTSVVAARSKAKAKPQPREFAGTTTTIPIHQRRWIDIEPSKQDLASYDLSKKVINLLRHKQTLQREQDGAIEFCKIKFHLRNHHSQIQNWSDDRWKACLAAGGGSKRRYQYCSVNFGTIVYLRALQGHSGSSLIDPTLQDNVWNWNIPLHLSCWVLIQSSLYYQQWIDTWRSEFEQKTNGVLLACWSKKWKSQRPWLYWLLCTTSRAIHA